MADVVAVRRDGSGRRVRQDPMPEHATKPRYKRGCRCLGCQRVMQIWNSAYDATRRAIAYLYSERLSQLVEAQPGDRGSRGRALSLLAAEHRVEFWRMLDERLGLRTEGDLR